MAVDQGPNWTLSRLMVKFNVRPEGVAPLPEAPPGLGEGQVDPVFEWLKSHGRVTGERNARGFYEITCPWENMHTMKGSTGYLPGAPGAFSCFHGHCKDAKRDTKALKAWILEQDPSASLAELDVLAGLDLQGIGQGIAAALAESERRSREAPEQCSDSEERVRFRAPGEQLEGTIRKQMIDNYIHVEAQNKYWSVQSKALVERAAIDDSATATLRRTRLLHNFNEAGKRLKDIAASAWLRGQPDLRRVGNVTHRMGGPLIVDDCLNIAPPIPAPVEYAGEPVPWLELVNMVLRGDKAAIKHWLNWAALLVTAWDEKPGWVPMLKGPPGAGKGLMLNPVKRYVGADHWIMVQPQELQGTFTYFAKKRLVIIEELKQIGQGTPHKMDIYTLIKKWTGRGNRMVSVRDLGREPYAVLDLSGWSIYSNEYDPLPLEKGERRIAVFITAPPQPDDWYLPIGKWIDGEGFEMIIGWLQKRWHNMSEAQRETVRGNAPMTEAKQELIDVSGGGMLAGAIRLCISGRHGQTWPDLMTMLDITTALSRSDLLSQYDTHKSLGEMAVSRALRNEGAVLLFDGKQVEYPQGCKLRLWCLRGEKLGTYEALGKGKLMVETYQAMKTGAGAIRTSDVPGVVPFAKKSNLPSP